MKYFLCTLIFLLICSGSLARPRSEPSLPIENDPSPSLSLAINPLKPFLGLINLEFEYRFSPRISFHIFGEVLLREKDHPDIVLSAGPRFYRSDQKDTAGLYTGLNGGFIWYRADSENSRLTLGGELGFKAYLGKSFYLLPRGLLTWPVGSTGVLPGFECLGGYSF